MARNSARDDERCVAAVGTQARRKWSMAEKVRVVREMERSGAAMSDETCSSRPPLVTLWSLKQESVRHGIANLLIYWRARRDSNSRPHGS